MPKRKPAEGLADLEAARAALGLNLTKFPPAIGISRRQYHRYLSGEAQKVPWPIVQKARELAERRRKR